MPQNIIFLIALLVIIAAMVIFTFVFVILVDRSSTREGNGQQSQGSTDDKESS